MARSCGEGGVEDWTYFLDCLLMFNYGSLSLFDGSSILDIGSDQVAILCSSGLQNFCILCWRPQMSEEAAMYHISVKNTFLDFCPMEDGRDSALCAGEE